MSQWNNSYSYNNQYQGSQTWNGDDVNGQSGNSGYYPNRQDSSQYVSFNDFISQIQSNNSMPSNTNYNNTPYENQPSGHINNYQNVPSSSQTRLDSYNYPASSSNTPNDIDPYQGSHRRQYNTAPHGHNSFTNEMILNSNLTPTAMEFVPKNSMTQPIQSSSSSQSIPPEPPEPVGAHSYVNDYKNNHSNKTNWRDRSHKDIEVTNKSETNDQSQESPKTQGNHSRNRETNNRNNSSKYHDTGRNIDPNSHNNDSTQNNDSNSRNYDTTRNNDSNGRNYDTTRNNDSNGRNYDYSRNHDANSRNYDSRNQESNRQESSNRNYEPQLRNEKRSITKNNKSNKNKDADARTFYNSSISRDSQDVRIGKGEASGRGRNWAGTQRLRQAERDVTEDEQYANAYLQQREERAQKDKSDREKEKVRPDREKERVRPDREKDRVRPDREKDRNRPNRENISSSPAWNKNKHIDHGTNKEMTQRERLTEQLEKGTLECLVCCERVRQTDSVWACSNCYHVLHLRCIRKWAMSSIVEGKWRCPACQNTNQAIPTEYRCMCGAARNPEYQRGGSVAHTCGRACRRARACPHPCTLLCHPGPCPPCQATITKQCGCGSESRSVLCSSKLAQVCGRVCSKMLACDVHKCAKDCHEGDCDECSETVTQVCFCSAAKSRSVPCTADTGKCASWSCGGDCARVLACGAHVCRAACHPPPCAACHLLPDTVLTCPCGKTRLAAGKRTSCADPIPLCGNICAKPLTCGPPGDKHFCKLNCHEGACPVCPDSTVVQCRCGHSNREVPCKDLPEMIDNVLCQKKCNKKLSCGRHRCRTVCCASASHRCAVVCGRTLSCQTHRCEEFCHTGHCAPCPRVSFTELTCECGAQVALPPVRCGARPPACSAQCVRARPCEHEPHHSCHTGPCPPCVVLTTKRCHGDHEERKTIPCSQEEFSCGLPCGKPLPCGKHTCIKTCHKGPCDTGKCTQPCNEKRPSCGHPCAAPCHFGAGDSAATPCPSSAPCRRLVRATCPCARRHAERPCADNMRDLAKMMSALAATKMHDGGSVDLSDVQRPGNMLKTLECDDECRVEARTRQLALALQIRNPDVSSKLAPRYTEHVRATAAKEPSFAQHTHDKLTELVQRAKKSKQKTRAHSFPSMNRQKRQFIHELCEQFGCESVAYDAEPNRNVVATADREKSWLPAMSVLEVLAREAGKRRVPGPMVRAPPAPAPSASAAPAAQKSGWATLTSSNAWAARSQPKAADKIDYFDNPPDQ